jgi:hypothetical protein
LETLTLTRIRQKLDDTRVNDIYKAVEAELDVACLQRRISPGARVAITGGSRGITDIVQIFSAVIACIRRYGGEPFVVPAMGSHGGATAEGQTAVLAGYGLTPERLGAPVVSSMGTVLLGETPDGIPVRIDRNAAESDAIVVLNRIKPHTEFHGCIESGLVKMMVIGMGKHEGALIAHRYAVRYGYEKTLVDMGKVVLDRAPVIVGLGILENGFGSTARIAAVQPETFLETEKKLLQEARRRTPKIPFDRLDILIVDTCGKEISGTGMDTKVIGRIMNIYEAELTCPRITRIVLRDLTDQTHGNAIGIGLADFVTRRVADRIDPSYTNVNCITAVTPEKGRIPIVCKTDRDAISAAWDTAGPVTGSDIRLVWIQNTSKLSELFVTPALLPEVEANKALDVLETERAMAFTEAGDLVSIW